MADGSASDAADPRRWPDLWERLLRASPELGDLRAISEEEAARRASQAVRQLVERTTDEISARLEELHAAGADWPTIQAELDALVRARIGPAGLATVVRTNVQTAFNATRFVQMANGSAVAARPFWRFVVIKDARTSRICWPLDRTVRRYDDPFWERHWPPLHFGCRSTVVALTPAEAAALGGETPPFEAPRPTEGFGTRPDLLPPLPAARRPASGPLREPMYNRPPSGPASARDRSEQNPGTPKGPPSPPAPQPHPFEPVGTPVSNALDVTPAAQKRGVPQALAAVDKVHGDGTLDRIAVETKRGDNAHAEFNYSQGGAPENVKVYAATKTPLMSIIHEVGHFLDTYAIGPPRRGWSAMEQEHPSVEGLLKALMESAPVRYLKELQTKKVMLVIERVGGPKRRYEINQKHVAYMLKRKELFARAYSQYIAVRSGDPEILAELATLRRKQFPIPYPEHWYDDEFVPIATEFDKLFVQLGWMRPTSPPSTDPGTPS